MSKPDWGSRLDTLMRALRLSYCRGGRVLGASTQHLQDVRKHDVEPTPTLALRILDLEELYAAEIEKWRKTGQPHRSARLHRPEDLAPLGRNSGDGKAGPASGTSGSGPLRARGDCDGAFEERFVNAGHPAYSSGLPFAGRKRAS